MLLTGDTVGSTLWRHLLMRDSKGLLMLPSSNNVLASVIKPDDFRPISSKQLFCSFRVGIAFEYDI